MEVKATLETRKSQKGKEYQVLVIKLTENYDKLVFLDNAELELIKLNQSQEPKFPDFN